VYDVVIVGGGPAGLSAALVLGRCRRQLLVCDDGHPRNARSQALHGYLTRDGVSPLELLRLGREELGAYDVEWREGRVKQVATANDSFEVTIDSGEQVRTRAVLLATGVRDHVPDIPGIDACYGISAHHCPYCDGWEKREQAIAVIGDGVSPVGLALSLKTWSDHIVAFTHGRARVPASHRQQLRATSIELHEAPIARVVHDGGRCTAIVLVTGLSIACDAIFFTAPQSQQCELARTLGCEFNRRGTVKTNHLGQTCVRGVYVVGDASRDVQFAIVAAAEGAKAGVAINQALQARAGLTPRDLAPAPVAGSTVLK
jgi:thioredoxin reductase